jgi:hypothetical protein
MKDSHDLAQQLRELQARHRMAVEALTSSAVLQAVLADAKDRVVDVNKKVKPEAKDDPGARNNTGVS